MLLICMPIYTVQGQRYSLLFNPQNFCKDKLTLCQSKAQNHKLSTIDKNSNLFIFHRLHLILLTNCKYMNFFKIKRGGTRLTILHKTSKSLCF